MIEAKMRLLDVGRRMMADGRITLARFANEPGRGRGNFYGLDDTYRLFDRFRAPPGMCLFRGILLDSF